MRLVPPLVAAALLFALVGCHSAFIEATVVNRTEKAIPLIEVDYPSASFGTQDLQPGGQYHYRFKVLGSGGTKLLWTDAAHVDRTVAGPDLHEGDEGTLTVTFIASGKPAWDLGLKNAAKSVR